jgi:hypothetical protein
VEQKLDHCPDCGHPLRSASGMTAMNSSG